MNETEKEHLKKVYTAYYSQIDFTKDFCEQNIKHIVNIQKQPTYFNTPLVCLRYAKIYLNILKMRL